MSDPFSSSKYIPRASGGDSLLNKEEFQSSNRQKPMPPKNATQFPDAVGKVTGHGSVWLFETMSHPFNVLRRSCQVSTGSTYHLTPFTLPTVVYQISRNKPPAWVYNGFISSLLARGFNMVAENVLNEMTNWPLSGYLVCAPFFITSFVVTVQSYGANDSPSLFEFFTDGITRLVGRTYHHTWLVPVWQLLVPTATFRLCHYTVQQVVSHLVVRFITEERNRVLTTQRRTDDADDTNSSILTTSTSIPAVNFSLLTPRPQPANQASESHHSTNQKEPHTPPRQQHTNQSHAHSLTNQMSPTMSSAIHLSPVLGKSTNQDHGSILSPGRESYVSHSTEKDRDDANIETAALSHLKQFQDYLNSFTKTPEWISSINSQAEMHGGGSVTSTPRLPSPPKIAALLSTHLHNIQHMAHHPAVQSQSGQAFHPMKS